MSENQPDNPGQDSRRDIAAAVLARAAGLLKAAPREPLDPAFVQQCLDHNERGDGIMYASLHRGRYLYNTTPEKGEWYAWSDHVWELDKLRRSVNAVEDCALEYQRQTEALSAELKAAKDAGMEIDKKHPDYWKVKLLAKYNSRLDRLRSGDGARKVLFQAPIVDTEMACAEEDFDRDPWLLPVQNGVIDLRTGALVNGRPEDRLRRRLELDYDPHADYSAWQQFIDEITDDPQVAAALKRILGYAITGNSFEQYISVFIGPGRNGKGVLFDLVGDVMRAYFHVISRAMILEQRNEPPPNAASEHKYSLLGKRIIVGAETNKGQRIDAAAVKDLTGDDNISCRPNFKSEINFIPSHTLFLHTNHVPIGLTKDFAMKQRLLIFDFPWMFVDDPALEAKKTPARAHRYKQKDPHLKDKLRKIKPGILRWLVEGCLEWQQVGLAPPASITDAVDKLAKEEDDIGQFLEDCMVHHPEADPDDIKYRLACADMYEAFRWWWSENRDAREQRILQMKTINTALRDRGYIVDKKAGKTWIYQYSINPDIQLVVDEFSRLHPARKS